MSRALIKYLLIFLMSLPGFIIGQVDSLLNEAKIADSDTARLRNLILVTEVCDIPDIEKFANHCIFFADSLSELGIYDENDLSFYKSTALNNLGFMHHAYGEYKEAIKQYQKCIKIYRSIEDSLGLSRGLNNIAMVYKDEGDTDKALDFLKEAYNISEPMGDYDLLNITLTNFGTIYTQIGDLDKAVDYLFQAIKLQEKNKDEYGLSHSYNTLASLYHTQQDYQKSMFYFKKAVVQAEATNDYDVLGSCYNNLGFIYDEMNEDSIALDYYQKSLELRLEINDPKGESECYSNIGSYYLEHGDTTKGIDYIQHSLEIREQLGEVGGLANTYQKLAGIYYTQKDIEKALKYGELSFEYANKIGYNEDIKNSALVMSLIYAHKNKFQKAYEMHTLYLEKRDLLFNKKNQKNIIEQEVDFEYAKKHLSDSLNTAKTLEVAELEKQYQQDKLDKANQRNWAMTVGMLLLILVVVLALIGYRNKKKSEQTISNQNEILEHQKRHVEEAHKEITDSINYAERIQRSFLASKELLDENLNDYFVFFQPKEAVSGDFYWADKLCNGDFAIVNADSTGHGVPGAIMSILNISSLESAIKDQLTLPADIFNHTRKTIINRLKKDGSEQGGKDGMDASLIAFNSTKTNMKYVAAQNPIWIIRAGEVVEVKPEKMPVGKHDNDGVPFKGGDFDLQKGDQIYTLTDGFQDQFGGPKGKKFMVKKMREYVLSISHLSMEEQHKLISQSFDEWKGDMEQVDDVCVIGIRV